MKTAAHLFAALLATTSVTAAPGTAARRARAEQRGAAASRSSRPMIPANVKAVQGPNNVRVEYSTNWAGAAVVGSDLSGVTATFVVPQVREPSGGSSETNYSASAWVGIDGYTCGTAILQTGVDFYYAGGEVSYGAWYEWYPDYSIDFDDISISAGDTITVKVEATTTSSGTATVENVSTGQTVNHTFSSESNTLCETNAEWIVEDYEEDDNGQPSLVPLVDFGTVTFSDAYATSSNGTVGVTSADLIDMTSSGTSSDIEVVASISGDNEVVVKYES